MSPFEVSSLSSLSPRLVVRMLDGDRLQRRRLAKLLLAHLDVAVFHVLRDHPHAWSRKDDLVADVMIYLYRNDAKILRAWDPDRAALKGYISMIATRFVRRHLAKQPIVVPLDDERPSSSRASAPAPAPASAPASAEVEIEYRSALARLHDHLRTHGSAKDQARFRAMFVQGRSPAEVAADEGATVDAIHTWASRLKRRLLRALPEVAALVKNRSDRR